jgi:hypothetical protein
MQFKMVEFCSNKIIQIDILYLFKGQSRQQVQQFAGLLAIKSTFQDQITVSAKPKVSSISYSIEIVHVVP